MLPNAHIASKPLIPLIFNTPASAPRRTNTRPGFFSLIPRPTPALVRRLLLLVVVTTRRSALMSLSRVSTTLLPSLIPLARITSAAALVLTVRLLWWLLAPVSTLSLSLALVSVPRRGLRRAARWSVVIAGCCTTAGVAVAGTTRGAGSVSIAAREPSCATIVSGIIILPSTWPLAHVTQVPGLQRAPQTPSHLAVATGGHQVGEAAVGVAVAAPAAARALMQDVVLMVADGLGGEQMVEVVAVGRLLCPLADGVEHLLVDLDALVAQSGVVECAEDVVDDFVDGDVGVFPGVEDAAGQSQSSVYGC